MSGVNEILDDLCEVSHDGKVTIEEMADAFGHRGAAPFLIIPPLLEISPIGGIPGLPTFLALTVAVFAVQIVLGRDQPHVPGKLGRRGVSGDKLRAAVEKLRPIAGKVDGLFRGRLPALTTKPMRQFAALIVLGLCLIVPPLELVPFASTLPMAAILAFGLAFLFRDGILMLAAFAVALGSVWGLATVVPWGNLVQRVSDLFG